MVLLVGVSAFYKVGTGTGIAVESDRGNGGGERVISKAPLLHLNLVLFKNLANVY